jgi:hypothetical protein
MKLPIILVEHGDILIFRSVEDAELALEPIDVRNGEYVAYDAEGRTLVLSVIIDEKPGLFGWSARRTECVKLIDNPEAAIDEAGLSASLAQFLNRSGVSLDGAKEDDLSALVASIVEKIGYSN